jgi:hypothetical protein
MLIINHAGMFTWSGILLIEAFTFYSQIAGFIDYFCSIC